MKFTEIEMDLFDVPKHYALAQCISADAVMGVGIAVEFSKRWTNMRYTLQDMNLYVGDVIGYNETFNQQGVLNLVTKVNYNDKPKRRDFNKAVSQLAELCVKYNITHLAMPRMGSGKDKLSWNKSREWIKHAFRDTDVEILVCIQ